MGTQEANPNRCRQTQDCGTDEANTSTELADMVGQGQDGKMDKLIPNEVLDRERVWTGGFLHDAGTLTGHGRFGVYLHKFKRRENATCELCHHTDEAQHVIFKCDAVVTERISLERKSIRKT